MLHLIITATLFITGLFAPKELVNQNSSTNLEVCFEVKREVQKSNFHDKQNTFLFQENKNQQKENERATI